MFEVGLVFVLGLIVGSFIGALTWRMPRYESIKKGRSVCPKCRNKIRWFDNIPVLSFFLLGGRCRNCKKKISKRYPLIEFTTALLFVFLYIRFGISLEFVFHTLLSICLVTIFVIDINYCFRRNALTSCPYFSRNKTINMF